MLYRFYDVWGSFCTYSRVLNRFLGVVMWVGRLDDFSHVGIKLMCSGEIRYGWISERVVRFG